MFSAEAPDEELVARLIDGDQGALSALYDRHAGRVYRIALRLTADPGRAEEIVQETMLALWDRAELYDPAIGSLGAWLATIARNRTIDRLRADGRRPVAMPLSGMAGPEEDDAGAGERALQRGLLVAAGQRQEEPVAASEAAWLRETLAAAVATLPPPERQVIELAYSRDLTQSEIAAHLGWPIGTVKTRTRRALAALRAGLVSGEMADRHGGSGDEPSVEGHAALPVRTAADRVDITAACAPC